MKHNRLLLVEDDEAILNMWKDELKEFGYSVKCATNYEDALGYENEIDLVITDLRIPLSGGRFADEKHGLNVMKYYRDRNMPVIVASYSSGFKATVESYGARKAESKDVRDILKEVVTWLK